MTIRSSARLRAFVREHTRLADVPDLPGIRLHIGADVMALCALAGEALGETDPDLPYWAFPWAGGLAIARHLFEDPGLVVGRTVLDVAAGSGLCGIVAARLGAASVLAVDRDPLAVAAIRLNVHANAVRVEVRSADVTSEAPPPVDVILAGDVCYQAPMAASIIPWLREAATAGSLVLLGDPGRQYLPPDLVPLAEYRVVTSRELEPSEQTTAAVYAVRGAGGGAGGGAVRGAVRGAGDLAPGPGA